MYVVMKSIPTEMIDLDAGVIKFWELKSPIHLKGLEIRSPEPELTAKLEKLTCGVLTAQPMERRLPNWYLDRVLYIKANHKVYILSRTDSILDL
jgi:hypothetical protein